MSAETPIDAREAAEFLHIHPDTLKERARAGLIKAYRPGRKWVFLKSDLLEYLKTQQPESHCSTAAPTRRTGMSDLKSVDRKLGARLGPLPEKRQPSLKIISGHGHGAK